MVLRILNLSFYLLPALCLHAQPSILPDSLLAHVRELSDNRYEGRRTQEPGNLMAGEYLLQRFRAMELKPLDTSYVHSFRFYNRWLRESFTGRNIIGYVRGAVYPDKYIVLSAHYDHVGRKNSKIYNGADDNASGTGALLEIARHFSRHPPRHSIIFAAFDAEELGLQGADAFVEEPPIPLENILFDLNMDMVGRNAKNELYICGAKHYPFFRAPLEKLAEGHPLSILFGHDEPVPTPQDDWTMSSDHGRFHQKGIPFLYFGVEDHEDYHQPTDDFERIMPEFYTKAVGFILESLLWLDGNWEEIGSGKTESERQGKH